jgi:hypothetical protein
MTAPATTPEKKIPSTKRWPAPCEAKGQFILLPKVVVKNFHEIFADLKLGPQHLLLLLVLQADRYSDRLPRYYWQELADMCGRERDTVRKWARELKQKGLLRIRPCKQTTSGSKRKVGYRNERNEFVLDPFLAKVETVQKKVDAERAKRRAGGGKN